MNITLSADEVMIKKARDGARKKGISLNAFIRDQMSRLADGGNDAVADELFQLAMTRPGKSPKGYRFDRQEIHSR